MKGGLKQKLKKIPLLFAISIVFFGTYFIVISCIGNGPNRIESSLVALVIAGVVGYLFTKYGIKPKDK